jgi:DNA-binding CsgD family transcriptional regulator/pimeloyl-ACP methyl ester carboxylesterase
VEAVVAAAGLGQFSIFAHSDAGAAIDYAAANSDRVSHIVLLSAPPETPEIPDSIEQQIALRRINRRVAAKALVESMVPDGGTREWVERFVDYSLAVYEIEVLELLDRMLWHDQWPLLPKIEAEALVICRVGDVVQSVEEAREVAGMIRRARLLVLPGRDHIPTTPEQVQQLVEPMLAFFPRSPGRDRREPAPETPLSPREVEVLRLVAAGKSNAEIAEELVIASGTVARHVSNILNKTALSNRTELAAYAIVQGFVAP